MHHEEEFDRLVRNELKNDATDNEIDLLKLDQFAWRVSLIKMKLSIESQMAASKTRRFELHVKYRTGELSEEEYLVALQEELKWKVNANRLLQQIETKMQEITQMGRDI